MKIFLRVGQTPLTPLLRLTRLTLAVMAGLWLPVNAHADGMFVAPKFVWDKQKDINEPTQKAIIVYDAGREDLILQVKYGGPVSEFGWLIPVPNKPTVEKGDMECFYELSKFTQRQFEYPSDHAASKSMTLGMDANVSGRAEPDPVKVVEIKTIGAYEIAVLSTEDTGALERWLKANHFEYPQDKSDVLAGYVKQHWYFVAVKINLKASWNRLSTEAKLANGELNPLHLTFASDQCIFPLKISSVNGTPSEVQVYVLSAEPRVERGMFEKDFPEVRRLSVEHYHRRIETMQRLRQNSRAMMQRLRPELAGPPPMAEETNVPLNQILRNSVPYEKLLQFTTVDGKEFPACGKTIPHFADKTWWLIKDTWTFKPEEMRDLVFAPAAMVFAEDLAGDEGYYAAQNLTRLGSNAVPVLLQALQSSHPAVRIHAASALTEWNGMPFMEFPQLAEALAPLFHDAEPEVRMDAAVAAGQAWRPEFATSLIGLMQDEDQNVRQAAGMALSRNSQKMAEPPDALLTMLRDTNLEVRANALQALANSPVVIPRELLVPLLNSTNVRAMGLAVSRLERDGMTTEDLMPLLHSSVARSRQIGLGILQRLGDKQTIGLVIPFLRDPDAGVQRQAGMILRQFSGQTIPADQPAQWEQWWADNKNTFQLADATKAIADYPQDGDLYHSRGCLYYNAQDFTNALADFKKAWQLKSQTPDYSHYRAWLIRARWGETAAATQELATYLQYRINGKAGDWPGTVGRFLAGQLSEDDFLKAAENPNPQTSREQHCEAWFYIGSKRLIAGDTATAADDFKKCLATGVVSFEEYGSAEAQLKRLKP